MKYKESSTKESNEEQEKTPPKKEIEINNSLTEEDKIMIALKLGEHTI